MKKKSKEDKTLFSFSLPLSYLLRGLVSKGSLLADDEEAPGGGGAFSLWCSEQHGAAAATAVSAGVSFVVFVVVFGKGARSKAFAFCSPPTLFFVLFSPAIKATAAATAAAPTAADATHARPRAQGVVEQSSSSSEFMWVEFDRSTTGGASLEDGSNLIRPISKEKQLRSEEAGFASLWRSTTMETSSRASARGR